MSDLRAEPQPAPASRRMTSLELANEMYKDAFRMKRTRFAVENPQLSEAALDRMTARYFAELPSSPV